MSEELREAIETASWEFVEYEDASREIDLAREVAYAECYDGYDY